MANQVDFKILPSDQFNVYSPQTRSEKVITYFTLLSKLRGDILAVSSQDDPNSIVSAYYTNVGNTQTLHLVKADGSEVTASNSFAGTVTSVGVSMPSAFTVTNSPITTSGTIQITGAGTTAQYVRGDGTLATFPSLTGFVPYVGATQNVDLGEYQIKAGQVAFDLTPTGTAGVGIMRWNDQDGTADLGLLGGNVTLQIGQEQVVRVVNKSGINLTEAGYQAVKITGAQGNRLKVGLAQANNDANSADTIGLVTENIALNAEGFVTSSGLVHNIDTTGALQGETWADGDIIYLSPTTPGAVTKVKPTAPQHTVILGFVVRAHQTQGQIYVKVDNGYELEELHDVAPTPYVNNGVLYRDTATNLWKSATIPTVLGYTPANSTTTISTTAPLSGGGDLSANRTLSISQAGASTDGYLSSTDWNTFNNKASDAFKTIAVTGQSNIVADSPTDTLTFEAGSNIVITTDAANDKITINALGGGSGSVTSVDMSVPTGFAISGNPITTSGTLALAFAGGYSLPTNASQTNWDTAYNNSITAFSYNTSTGVLTLTQQDAGTLTATVTLQPFTTDNLTQGSTNLYDKVVSLTGAGTTVVTGTYPNFTITSNDQHAGTVTSIATSAPITGGTITTSGTIGITQSGAAADGYLSSTDWNTFNSKVGGSGTINYVSKWTSTGAIGNSQIFDSGTYVGINTATPAAKLDISGAHVASVGLLRLNSSASNVAAQTYYIDGVYKAATYAGTDDNFYILGRDADIVFSTTSSATTRMVITSGGNVGIGTSGPTQKLTVSGSIRVTGGYYDSSNSIGSNGQVLASTGSGTTWINASGGTVNGSGTVNYIPKWTGTTLLADSQLFDNGTNVGVGTATPNRKLTVSGNGTLLGLQSSTAGGYSEMEFTADGVSGAYIFKASSGFSSYAGAGSLNIYNSGAIGFHTASVSNAMFIASATGNVGLGNTAPTQKLHVEGNIRVTGAYYDSANGAGSSGQVLSSTGSGTSWITPFSASGTTNYVAKWTSGTALGNSQIFDNGTNVGIGTASPTETLDLRGVLRVSRSGVNDSGIIAFGNYVNGAGYYDNGIFRSALNAITTSGNTLHMGSYEALAFTTSANPLGSQSIRMYISGSDGNVGIGTTSPSRLLHVAGNAQVDGWLFQGGYYNGSVTIPEPSANYGNGRVYLRLCSSASGRIMTAKVRISSTWNWAPAFGSVEADISFYWTGSSLAYSYVNILSATGQAATNLTFGALEVEGGSISVPIYSVNTNPIYAYIQLSPDADPSQVSYSTWSSVAFPGQANVYVQTSLGVGTPSPSALLHVNGTFKSNAFFTLSNGVSYWGPNGVEYGYLTWDTGYAKIGGSGSNTLYLGGSNQITILNGGNVGIGEITPSQKLHVTGNVRVTGAYYDSSNAAGTSGQILSSTGTGTAWIAAPSGGGVSGSGTTNYVTKWTSGSAVGNSSIYDNGYVGIGTTAPAVPFEIVVNSSVGVTGNVYFLSRFLQDKVNYRGPFFGYDTSGSIAVIGAESAGPASSLAFYTYSSGWGERMRISGTNVGIGTPAPDAKLHVSGLKSILSNYGVGSSQFFTYEIVTPTSSSTNQTFDMYMGRFGNGYHRVVLWGSGYGTDVGNYFDITRSWGTGSAPRIISNGGLYIGGATYTIHWAAVGNGQYDLFIKWTANMPAGYSNTISYAIQSNTGSGYTQFDYPSGVTVPTLNSSNLVDSVLTAAYNTGNVGIGTTAPDAKLVVTGDSAGTAKIGGISIAGNYTGISLNGTLSLSHYNLLSAPNDASLFINRPTGNAIRFRESNSEQVTIATGGNVGINETAPSQKLHVSGNIRVTGAYYDSANSAGTSGQILSSTGTGTAWIAAPSGGGVSGSGTTNYVTKWTSGSAVGDSSIFDNGNVGIGTTTPQKPLEVISGVNDFVSVGVNQIGVGQWTGIHFGYREANSLYRKSAIVFERTDLTANDAQGKIHILNGPQGGSGSATLANAKLTIAENGNVGIGTTAPESLLHLSQASTGGDGAFLFIDNPASSTLGNTAGIRFATNAGASFSGYGSFIQAVNTNAGNGAESLTFGTWNGAARGERMRIDSSGSVGINTTNPGYKLDVIGSVRSYGGLFSNGYHADTYIENLLPAANNGSGQGDVQLRMWCSEPGITWSWAGFGYNVKNDGASPYGFGRVNTSFGQAYMRMSTDGNWYFYNANTSGTRVETMTLTNAGNVGIGTTSPNNALTINRDTGAGNISSMPGVVFRNKNTTNSIFVHSGIFADTYRDVADPHYSGGIWFTRVPLSGNLTSGSDIIFGTGGYVSSGAFPDERMRITWDGAVGIGATAPTTTLDVRRNVPASSGTFPVVRVGNSSGDWGNYSMIEASNVPDGRAVRFGAYLGASAYSQGGFAVVTGDNGDIGTNPSIKLFVRHDGNVGIGTTAPTSKLYIEGGSANWNETTPGLSVGTIHLDPGTDTNDYGNAITFGASDAGGGTNAQAGIYLRSDGNYGTKMYFATTDSYAAGSKTRMFIGHDGNVGIGTTAPITNLHVQGTNTEQVLISYDSTKRMLLGRTSGYGWIAPYTNGVSYDNLVLARDGGNVGIGTTAPNAKLVVVGDGSGTAKIGSAGFGGNYTGISLNGTLNQSSYNFLSSTSDNHLYINRPTGNDIYFRLANNDQVTIKASGKVGIGTPAPSYTLDVHALDLVYNVRFYQPSNASTSYNGNIFTGAMTSAIGYFGVGGSAVGNPSFRDNVVFGSQSNHPVVFNTNDAERMRITSAGNVGIGTTAPTAKLHAVTTTGAYGSAIAKFEDAWSVASLKFTNPAGASFGLQAYAQDNPSVYTNLILNSSGGNVGIGTTNPSYKLDVSGTIRATGDVIAYSDARVKENVETLDGALDKVMKMRGVSYNKIGEQEKKVGVIAQEILEVLPEVVSQDESGTYSVAYGNIVSVLIEAIKEQQKQIDELKAKLK